MSKSPASGIQGQAVGGLGGGIWTSVVYPEPSAPHSAIQPLRSTGGWAQLKVTPATRFEINGAFGQDENYGQDLRVFPFSFTSRGFLAMQKNRTDLVNFIYRPTSFLLFAVEWRHLFTLPANAAGQSGDQSISRREFISDDAISRACSDSCRMLLPGRAGCGSSWPG